MVRITIIIRVLRALHITVTVTNDLQTSDDISKTLRIISLSLSRLTGFSIFNVHMHRMYLPTYYYYIILVCLNVAAASINKNAHYTLMIRNIHILL